MNFLYIFLLFIFLITFSISNKFIKIYYAGDKLNEIHKNLNNFAILFAPQDKEFSNALLDIDKLISSYQKGNDIIKNNKDDISKILEYFQKDYKKFYKIGMQKYSQSFEFLSKFFDYKKDIFSLLGAQNPQTYLILLQNNSEKRPGGGFFGSYGVLKIDGTKWNLQIFDTYYPEYISSGAYVLGPDYINQLGMTNRLSFVGPNKYGFTDIDGKNIKNLYEKIFNEKIRGIIFIDTNFIKDALSDFGTKLWEWQFVNASVDLIRGDNLPFKKEQFIKEINEYIVSNKMQIIKNFLMKFNGLVKSGHIKFYITDISDEFDNFLTENDLKTIYENNKIFCFDYNRSYNKIDGFIDKSIQIIDGFGNIFLETSSDILDIQNLPKGKYTLKLVYNLNVSLPYQKYISQLEKKYKITLGDREKHILGLNYLRDNQSIIYIPKNLKITGFTGDFIENKNINNNFAQVYSFELKTQTNNDIKFFEMFFEK